jgi:phosphate transport system substrate-binding protein
MRKVFRRIARAAAAALALAGPAAAGDLTVGGTGASLGYMRQMAERYEEATGRRVTVLPSLGSTGGNRAVAAGAIDVSISGRPLKEEERAAGLVATPLFRTPFCFFTSAQVPLDVASGDVWRLFADVGAPNPVMGGERVRVVVRSTADSDQAYAKATFPRLAEAYEAARAAPGVPLAQSDQQNADLAESLPHSLTTGTLVQMRAEGRSLAPLSIDGVAPSAEAVRDGSYPYAKTLHVVLAPETSEAAQDFVAFLMSEEGARVAQGLGALVER